MTKLLQQAISELKQLEELPEEDQNNWATSILHHLRTRRERQEAKGEVEPYSSFDVLAAARLPGPPDASVTYERELYGREDALDA